MGFFTQYTEVDALNKIEAINMEMKEICALIHANANLINSKNSSFIRQHCENIVFHINDYENIKSKLSEYDKTIGGNAGGARKGFEEGEKPSFGLKDHKKKGFGKKK